MVELLRSRACAGTADALDEDALADADADMVQSAAQRSVREQSDADRAARAARVS